MKVKMKLSVYNDSPSEKQLSDVECLLKKIKDKIALNDVGSDATSHS